MMLFQILRFSCKPPHPTLCSFYFWLCPSPVCSCSLLHCFVYIADEPQHLNCDASVKDWVEHVKINNTPPPIFLLSNKPASLRGPSLWGAQVRTTWVSQCSLFLSLYSPPNPLTNTHTHTHRLVLYLVLLVFVFSTASPPLFYLSFALLNWCFSGNVISSAKKGQLITHSILIG